MIIAQGQLASVVPIEPAGMVGRNVIQWDKEDVSDMGLIKVDLLGLGMMAVLKDCVELIPRHYGKKVDIAQIPHDDPKVYESLRRADTVGLFQVESRAQMASLPRNNPDKFYDLVVQVAIIRPGPIVGKMMHPYMERRQGRQEVPSLTRADLTTLAEVGALNSIGEGIHRREALWQVERAVRKAGALFEELDRDEDPDSPLRAMKPHERMVADYASSGVTVGWHPMAHCRARLRTMEVIPARDLAILTHGVKARIAGCVIARQRPGTAHGFIFLSIEDETGISNAIIDPDLYESNRSLVTYAEFLLVEGTLQNVDKVIHVRAKHIEQLDVTTAPMQSHNWH